MGAKSCSALFLLFLLLCIPPYAPAEILLDPGRQFEFAEQYFQRGEFYRAIGEYERFIYFFPLSDKVPLARYMIGLSYLRGERYEEAIQAFNALIEEYQHTEYALKSYLGVSKAYALLKHYDMALTTLDNLITIGPDQQIRDEAHYQKGWVYLEMGMWEKARDGFEKISPENREKYNVKQILIELKKRRPIRQKSPTMAGLLAIIPGAGHLYCDRKRDALISFLLNGAMIYAAYEAFDHDLDALGGVITLFELGFYSGNIYSAVSSAHKYNRNERNRFLNYLKKRAKINILLVQPDKDKSLLLACQFSF
jgi:tetratricopeptide (TPR) repeat protein